MRECSQAHVMQKESLHNCIVKSVLTCSAGGEPCHSQRLLAQHQKTAWKAASEDSIRSIRRLHGDSIRRLHGDSIRRQHQKTAWKAASEDSIRRLHQKTAEAEDCTAVFCFFIYRQQRAFRGPAKRHIDSGMRAAVPQVDQQSKSSSNNIQGVDS